MRRPLAEDTPLEIEQVQIAMWQRMTPSDKMRLVSGLCRRLHALAAEAVKRRHPQASAREQFLRLAIVRLGYDLAVEAFPDAAGLDSACVAKAISVSGISRDGSVPARHFATFSATMSNPIVRPSLPNSTTKGRPT